ncbi:MAG: transpeptidase family protein [Bacteroidales bacterium]|nr:transpeptidase family protein [Candidatus Colimorpha onthohippi]
MENGNNSHNMKHRMVLTLWVLIMIGATVLLWGLIKIQWVDGDFWRARSQSRKITDQRDPATRGDIFSSDGKTLATSLLVCDLYLDLGHRTCLDADGRPIKDADNKIVVDTTIRTLAFDTTLDLFCQMLHRALPTHSAAYYKTKLSNERRKAKPNQCMLIAHNVPYTQWAALSKVPGWERGVVKSINGKSVAHQIRTHIYGNMAGNVMGFSYGYDNKYTGLEKSYDSLLRGQDGIYRCRRLTRGTWLPDDNIEATLDSTPKQMRIDGMNITSTIDTRLQDIAEQSLRKALIQGGGTSGCAILMEVSTGYVLACSNLTRDTTSKKGYTEQIDHNIACSDMYEPGSTFKTVVLTAIMNDTSVNLDTSLRLRCRVKNFDGTPEGEIVDEHALHDTMNVAEVVINSSNVGMSDLGWRYYKNRRKELKDAVCDIFPTQAMHLDLGTAEYNQRFISLRPTRSFLNFCFGYSTAVSPMQMITFYNAIAGNGRMVKPLFCKEVNSGSSNPTTIQPVILNEHICTAATAKCLQDILRQVVERGTATTINNTSYGIAGKTGTAKTRPQGECPNNASFIGFFPADNPKYTCMVLIKNTYRSGGTAAAPVVKQIADCAMALDQEMGKTKILVHDDKLPKAMPSVPKGYREDIAKIYKLLGLDFRYADTNNLWVSYDNGFAPYTPPSKIMPDCKGMSIKDAMRMLHKMGLKVKFSGYGKVANQTPKARTSIEEGQSVILQLK